MPLIIYPKKENILRSPLTNRIVCPFWKCWLSGSKEYEQSKKAVSPDLDVSATPILVMGSERTKQMEPILRAKVKIVSKIEI